MLVRDPVSSRLRVVYPSLSMLIRMLSIQKCHFGFECSTIRCLRFLLKVSIKSSLVVLDCWRSSVWRFGGILAIVRYLVLDGRLFVEPCQFRSLSSFPERKRSLLTLSGILSMDTSAVVLERWPRSFLFFCRILVLDALRFSFMSKRVNNHIRARFGVLKALHWDMFRKPFHPETSRRARPLTSSFEILSRSLSFHQCLIDVVRWKLSSLVLGERQVCCPFGVRLVVPICSQRGRSGGVFQLDDWGLYVGHVHGL
jgi:hypothetical protein